MAIVKLRECLKTGRIGTNKVKDNTSLLKGDSSNGKSTSITRNERNPE